MKNKFLYILSTFNSIYGLNEKDYSIGYGDDDGAKLKIKKGETDVFSRNEKYFPSHIIWKTWAGVKIPFFFDNVDSHEILTFENGLWRINYDIIASSFYFLSNWQEMGYVPEGNIKRFPFNESLQYKLNIAEVPIVNYYFDILKTGIERAYDIKIVCQHSKDLKFTTFVSHDIDTCESAWLQGGYRSIVKGKLDSAIKLGLLKIFRQDAWFNFDYILEMERKENIPSTFFFLPRQQKRGDIKNADYDIKRKKFEKVFESIRANQSEIAMHASLGSYDTLSHFSEDRLRINSPVIGNRFHFLEFDILKTPEILERCNIKFDSSLYFAEHIGFRSGICCPFNLYDIVKDRPTSVLEIPLTIMDGTLQNKKYMNITQEEIESRLSSMLDEIKRFNGIFTILWHNTHFSDYKYKGWKDIYKKILQICREKETTFMNGEQIVKKYAVNI